MLQPVAYKQMLTRFYLKNTEDVEAVRFVQSPQMFIGRFLEIVSALLLAKLKRKFHVQANT